MTMMIENVTNEIVMMRIAMKICVTLEDASSKFSCFSTSGKLLATSCTMSSKTASLLELTSISSENYFNTSSELCKIEN